MNGVAPGAIATDIGETSKKTERGLVAEAANKGCAFGFFSSLLSLELMLHLPCSRFTHGHQRDEPILPRNEQ